MNQILMGIAVNKQATEGSRPFDLDLFGREKMGKMGEDANNEHSAALKPRVRSLTEKSTWHMELQQDLVSAQDFFCLFFNHERIGVTLPCSCSKNNSLS